MPYADPERKRQHGVEYRRTHRRELAAKQREYYRTHQAECDAANRVRTRARPWYYIATVFANGANRNALRQGVAGKLFGRQVKEVVGACVYCGGTQETWDHVMPLCRGGPNTIANLVPCCIRCNRRKGRKLPTGAQMTDRADPEAARRGDNNVGSIMTDEGVREMRRRYKQGGVSQRALGREFGISSSQAHLILTRQGWAWLED